MLGTETNLRFLKPLCSLDGVWVDPWMEFWLESHHHLPKPGAGIYFDGTVVALRDAHFENSKVCNKRQNTKES